MVIWSGRKNSNGTFEMVHHQVIVLRCSVVSDMHCSHQAPLSLRFSRQEYRSGLPFPAPGDLEGLLHTSELPCKNYQIISV